MAPAPTPPYFHGGAGPRALLLHSGFCTWVEWRRTLALLEGEREVLAPTLPGSLGGPKLDVRARTMLAALADHAEQLLDEVGWDQPVTVVGSSFGGVVGLELAVRGRAQQVIALAPPWVTGRGLAFYAACLIPPVLTFRPFEATYRFTSRSRRYTGLFFGHGARRVPDIDPADVVELWKSMGRFPLVDVGRHHRLRGPGFPAVDEVDVPVTLYWGTRDMWVPGWMRENWERALPGAEVVELDEFPHQPHLRDPARIATEILERTSPNRT